MKKIVLSVILFATMGCKVTTVKKNYKILYIGGDIETITITERGLDPQARLYFSNGCLYRKYVESKYEPNYQDCVVCGVRSYGLIEEF